MYKIFKFKIYGKLPISPQNKIPHKIKSTFSK